MKPMLAFNHKDKLHHITYPLHIQPKLDGLRAICFPSFDTFQSRDENRWHPSLLTSFSHLYSLPPNIILDGEFYHHGWKRQRILSAMAVTRQSPTPDTPSIQYHIFDCLVTTDLNLTFPQRHAVLTHLAPHILSPSTFIVPTQLAQSYQDVQLHYSASRSEGFEGSILRTPQPYGLQFNCGNQDNRWPCLLKVKDRFEAEYPIVGVYEECDILTRAPKGLAAGVELLTTEGRIFRAGGLSHQEKIAFWSNPPVGLEASIEYDSLSSDLVPLQASFVSLTPASTCQYY